MKTLLLLSLVIFTFSFGYSQVDCLQKAWIDYEKNNWNEAIQQAKDCTIQFGPRARKTQKDLLAQNYTFPCDFNVPNDCTPAQKDEIFSHGLLNDVAASYWIIGMCSLRLENNDAAKNAFEKAKELTFGLCYNPDTKNFWSPSEEAELQLDDMD